MKLRIAVIFGSNSPEYRISLKSAAAVIENLDKEKYKVIPIGITKSGKWYYYRGSLDRLLDDSWYLDYPNLSPVRLFALKSKVDIAFPILHGKNGEDGSIQGLLQLADIPVLGCNTLSSAICMNKDMAHKLVSLAGVKVPKSILITQANRNVAISEVSMSLKYPVFVKPVGAGSSFGITKVTCKEDLEQAINLAFDFDTQVVCEEAISGFEVGCAILGNKELLCGRVDEVEVPSGFFDYKEKYTQESAKIHMPARINISVEKKIQSIAKVIYNALGCSDFARIDMFLTPDGDIVFNEVNTIPGMTTLSRFPQMIKGIGLSFSEMLDFLISEKIKSMVF